MSDYLRNLINRIHLPQDAVRPRLAARFEPAPGLGDAPDPTGLRTTVNPTDVDASDLQSSILAQEAPVGHPDLYQRGHRGPNVTADPGEQSLLTVGPKQAPQPPAPWPSARLQPSAPMPIGQNDKDHAIHREINNEEAYFQRLRRTVTPQAPVLPEPLGRELAATPAVAHDEETAITPAQAPMDARLQTPVSPPHRQLHNTPMAQAMSGLQPLRRSEALTTAIPPPGAHTSAPPVGTSEAASSQPHPATRLPRIEPLVAPVDRGIVPSSALTPDLDPVTPPMHAKTIIAPRLAEPPPAIDTHLSVRLAAPPVIRVTIGRIEVRATTPRPESARRPSAPTARPSPPQPALSLDEYLKQRGGSR